MYYYFSSATKCAIKLNGIYFGIISDSVKAINIDDCPLVEICPLTPNDSQINFLLSPEFLSSPPDRILVTDMQGGFLIRIQKNYATGDFSVIAQEKFSDLVATVFIENGLKISIETTNGFFADSIRLISHKATIQRATFCGHAFVLVFIEGEENLLNVYSLGQQIEKVFSRNVNEYSFENELFTVNKYEDILKHTVNSKWLYENSAFIQKEKTISYDTTIELSSLPQKIIPFAFFEEVLIGGNINNFLSESILPNADRIKEYLGDFIGIMPPPPYRNIDEVGLVYPNGQNKYKVNYFTCEMERNKICNIKKAD